MMRQVLQTGCLIAGILCLFYFVLIMSYVKHTEWFQFVWLTAAVMFLGLWRIMDFLQRHELPVLQNAVNLLFVLIAAFGSIIFKIIGMDLYSMAAGFAVCLLITLYWISYVILRRKY